jgi:peptidoglycan/LPS O-acetylase OafA/YrhL
VGELSFGIYALHVPLTFGFYRGWLEPLRAVFLGNSALAYIPGFLIMTFVVFVAADYFGRLDKRVVRLGRWLQEKTFTQWEK